MISWLDAFTLCLGVVWIAGTILCALSCLCEGALWVWKKLT